VTNPVVKNFFKLDYERWDKAFREQAISPVLNKVRAFLSDPALLHIIGQKRSSFDIRWAMDTNKVVLVSLPKGMLGAHVSKLIGSLLVTKISLASLSRQDTPQHLRVPHILYIDEAHSYALGVDYETILAEARKFALGLVLASQTLSQFSESAVAAMFGNASTIASYRVSHDDAQRIVRTFGVSGEGPKTAEQIFETVVPPSELQQLPDFISSCKPFATAGRMSLSSCRASLPSLPRTYAGSGATRAGRRTRST
jgi:hypothetical protein